MGTITPHPSVRLHAPQPLSDQHDLSQFSCGRPALDVFLKHRALTAEARTARTFVLLQGMRVIGYYTLTVGSVTKVVPRKLRAHGSPKETPVIIISRLAIDREFQGKGLGKALVKDALLRSLGAADSVGVRAILIHALDARTATLYERFDFMQSPVDPRTYVMALEIAKEALG